MKGVIHAIVRQRTVNGQVVKGGFFFIMDENQSERFAHASNILPPATFDTIREGQEVDFEPVRVPGKGKNGGDGLRADRVCISAIS